MVIALALGGMIFWIGLATTPFVERMRPSLEALEIRVQQGSVVGVASLPGSREKDWEDETPAAEASLRVHPAFVGREGERVENDPTPDSVRAVREPPLPTPSLIGGGS